MKSYDEICQMLSDSLDYLNGTSAVVASLTKSDERRDVVEVRYELAINRLLAAVTHLLLRQQANEAVLNKLHTTVLYGVKKD